MTKRILASATLTATLALSGLAGAAFAQDTVEPADEATNGKTTTGTITMVDGVWYLTPTGGGEPIELSFGPSWFSDLAALYPDLPEGEVIVGGNLRGSMPNENASEMAMEKAVKDPLIKINTINGQKRAKGKPPWAGGPKDVGEAHPGYEGWSRGQAEKEANKPPKPEKPAKPEKAANGKSG